MPIVYVAVRRFDPSCGDDWFSFIEWSGLKQLRHVVSLDGLLCPFIFHDLTAEDWNHNVHEDCKINFFNDLDYLESKVAGNDRANIVAVCQAPTPFEVVAFTDPRFVFCGFDLVDHQGGISALVNCGGFPKAFSPTDLSDCGLLIKHEMALNVQRLLRAEYPNEHHARCEIWAIWLLKV